VLTKVYFKRAIHEFLDQNNKAPKPFIWTKTDDILASIARFAQRTPEPHSTS